MLLLSSRKDYLALHSSRDKGGGDDEGAGAGIGFTLVALEDPSSLFDILGLLLFSTILLSSTICFSSREGCCCLCCVCPELLGGGDGLWPNLEGLTGLIYVGSAMAEK